jgi:hypothetical protein
LDQLVEIDHSIIGLPGVLDASVEQHAGNTRSFRTFDIPDRIVTNEQALLRTSVRDLQSVRVDSGVGLPVPDVTAEDRSTDPG